VSNYVPLLTTLAWIVFIVGILVVFRKQLARIVAVLEDRIRGGAAVKLGSFEIGQLVTETADLNSQAVEIYGNPDQLKLLFKV
jgi:hypothetical protein